MLNERRLTPSEANKRDEIVSNIIKNKRNLVSRYGKDAEKVAYGRATNIVKKNTEKELEDLLEFNSTNKDNNFKEGDYVKINPLYGGGKGTITNVNGSFITVKLENNKENEIYHFSDLTINDNDLDDPLNELESILEKMTPSQIKKRGEIYDALKASGMSDKKAGRIATAKAIKYK
jgi:hypothetical protein